MKYIIKNQGFGLPKIGDSVLIRGTQDAVFITEILEVAEPEWSHRCRHQASLVVTGKLLPDADPTYCIDETISEAEPI